MRRRNLLAASGALGLAAIRPTRAATAVDLLLVLAVDVSRSVDEDEARLQRDGYRTALLDTRVVAAITGGILGAVALAYVEWGGIDYQNLVIPWTRIGSAADAAAWSEVLATSPRASVRWTSVSGALIFSGKVLADCPFEAPRRVIDVSGDGVNNSGPPTDRERDKLVAAGVTINGLPITNDRPNFGFVPSRDLEPWFRENVIGGPGAFLLAAEDFNSFGDAVRRKLIQEIAGLTTSPPAPFAM